MEDIDIRSTARIVDSLLSLCDERLVEDEQIHRTASNQLARFGLWASNIGVFAPRQSSLDYRLRTAPVTKAVIDGNLELLCKYSLCVLVGRSSLSEEELDAFADLDLTDVPVFVTDLYESSHENRALNGLHNQLRDDRMLLLMEVEQIIDTLHMQSLSIRKASDRNTLSRLPRLLAKDDSFVWGKTCEELQSSSATYTKDVHFDITKSFEEFCHTVLQRRWCYEYNMAELETAQKSYRDMMLQRCVTSIAARRRQLSYFRDHQARLSRPVKISKPKDRIASLGQMETQSNVSQQWQPETEHMLHPSLRPSETVFKSVKSLGDTEPSVFDDTRTLIHIGPPSAPSTTTTSSTGGAGFIGPFDTPPPPTITLAEKEKMCPYCCLVYPVKTFSPRRNKRRWRKHLIDDLHPYPCLYEFCDQAGKTFRSFKEWQAHLREPHTSISIRLSPPSSDDNEGISGLRFDTFENAKKYAMDYLPKFAQNETFQYVSQKQSIPLWCFVCLEPHTNPDQLQIHLAKHLENAHLLGLPERDDIDPSLVKSSGRASNTTHANSIEKSDMSIMTNNSSTGAQNLSKYSSSVPGATDQLPSLNTTNLKKALSKHESGADAEQNVSRLWDNWPDSQPQGDDPENLISAPVTLSSMNPSTGIQAGFLNPERQDSESNLDPSSEEASVASITVPPAPNSSTFYLPSFPSIKGTTGATPVISPAQVDAQDLSDIASSKVSLASTKEKESKASPLRRIANIFRPRRRKDGLEEKNISEHQEKVENPARTPVRDKGPEQLGSLSLRTAGLDRSSSGSKEPYHMPSSSRQTKLSDSAPSLPPLDFAKEPPTSMPSSSRPSRVSDFVPTLPPLSLVEEAPGPSAPGISEGAEVLFLAASLFEFSLDRTRREAGIPYLTYVQGELFDVLGMKGELWLARNQDDPTNTVGWIWEKHFARITPEVLDEPEDAKETERSSKPGGRGDSHVAEGQEVEKTPESTATEHKTKPVQPKSQVQTDRADMFEAAIRSAKFKKGDIVARIVLSLGRRTKHTGEVSGLRCDPRGRIEYLVRDLQGPTGSKTGTWFPERELRLER